MPVSESDREYGEYIADRYDDLVSIGSTDADNAVAFLAARAEGGRVLELGVGTGRLAVPLARLGCAVTGIDSSPAMLVRLKLADPEGLVDARLGSMAEFDVGGPFDLAFAACSTLYFLRTSAEQRGCLAAVSRHLRAGGRMVVEGFVPKPGFESSPPAVYLSRSDLPGPGLMIAGAAHSWIGQRLTGAKVHLGPDGLHLYPYDLRYLWPSELDLMAELCGLRLEARYADFHEHPLTERDDWYISVYQKLEQG